MKKIYSLILFLTISLFSTNVYSQCNGFAFGQAVCAGGCTGKATVFAFGGTAPYTYSWSSGATSSAAMALCVSTYTVTITDNVGCTVSKTASITAQSPPSLTVNSVNASCSTCADGSASVTPTGTGPFTYVWTPSGGTSDTAKALVPGTYNVCVTNIVTSCDSCTSVTVSFGSGITNYSTVNNLLKIYPNPVNDFIDLEFNTSISGPAIISIVNILGEEVYSEQVEPLSHEVKKLSMYGRPSGIYFVNVRCKDFTIRQKVIKE